MPYRGDTNRFEGRLPSDREAGETKAETGYQRAGRKACKRAWCRQVRGVFSIDAKGFEERL